MNLVQPRLSRGLRDLLPEDTLARQHMIDTVRRVYELYGFVPLTTPAVEYLDEVLPTPLRALLWPFIAPPRTRAAQTATLRSAPARPAAI